MILRTGGIKVNSDTLALKEIESVMLGEKNSLLYLGLEHTAKNIRKELFIPTLSERGSRNTWIKKGALDLISKAQMKIKDILASHEVQVLESELEKNIDDYIKLVDKRNTNEYGT